MEQGIVLRISLNPGVDSGWEMGIVALVTGAGSGS